jgi:thioesterase domain-containing protein/acyl carrier protein
VTEVAATICAMIGETLEIDDVTADEDFFELGGTSLLGTALLARIERRFGPRLRLADLYEAPTADGLAMRLVQPPPAGGSAISFAPQPFAIDAAPVFVIHAIPADLMRQIGRSRPVIGLSYGTAADRDDSHWPPPTGVEALAAHYMAELRRVQPVGPYHLVGHSRGGVIAWEMARQLGESGAEVGLLCLIDTIPAGWHRRPGWPAMLRNVASTPPHLLAQKVFRRALSGLSKQSWVQRVRWERSDQAGRLWLIDPRLDAYRMRPVQGRLVLVEATKPDARILSERPDSLAQTYLDLGLARDFHILLELPGDHDSVLRAPLVERVAEAIETAIVGPKSPPPG